MESNNILSNNDMRDIVYEICDEVCKKERLKMDVYPVTVVEYYKSDLFKKKIKLTKGFDKYKVLVKPFNCLGSFYESTREIVIFMNNFKKIVNVDDNYGRISFVKTIYHELRHAIQFKMFNNRKIDIKTNVAKFRFLLDYCKRIDAKDYEMYHDEYSQEIDADLYAMSKTKEYYYRNNKDIFNSNKNYFRVYDFYNKSRILKYDIQLSIGQLNRLLKKKENLFLLENYSILRFFYNVETGEYKNLSDIMNDSILNSFDYYIIANMLSSEEFLKKIDFSKLPLVEFDYLIGCIKYVYNDYLNRKNNFNYLAEKHKVWTEEEFGSKQFMGKNDEYILNMDKTIVKKINNIRKNDNYYEYLKKVLDEYKYHGKIVEGGKGL